MQPVSITKAFVVGLLAFAPLTVGFSAEVGVNDVQRRHVVSNTLLVASVALQELTANPGLSVWARIDDGEGCDPSTPHRSSNCGKRSS